MKIYNVSLGIRLPFFGAEGISFYMFRLAMQYSQEAYAILILMQHVSGIPGGNTL